MRPRRANVFGSFFKKNKHFSQGICSAEIHGLPVIREADQGI
jgi:hypothetical protein